jgi:hypothetical protein
MKFFKSLLLCFLFFGLGNFKAQSLNFNDSLKIMFLKKFDMTLKDKFSNKRVIIQSSKVIELEKLYSEKLNIIEEANTQPFFEKSNSQNFFKILYSTYLSQSFPDINAVFFNRGNLLSDEKISDEEKQKYNALFLEIAKQIPNETYIELSKLTDEIKKDKFALTVPYRFEIFQDLFDENQRKRIDIINFLLWNVE